MQRFCVFFKKKFNNYSSHRAYVLALLLRLSLLRTPVAFTRSACPHSLSARRACINLNGRMNVSGNNFSWLSTQVSNSGGYYLNANGDIDTYHADKRNSGWHHALCK